MQEGVYPGTVFVQSEHPLEGHNRALMDRYQDVYLLDRKYLKPTNKGNNMARQTKTKETSSEIVPVETKTQAIALPADKALTAGQLKNLGIIVEGDFTDLRNATLREVREAKQRKQAAVNERYADPNLDMQLKDDIAKEIEKANAMIQKVIDKHKSKGFLIQRIDRSTFNVNPDRNLIHVSNPGHQREHQEIEQASARISETIQHVLGTLERTTKRQLLLASIDSSIGADLVNAVPSAEALFAIVEEQVNKSNPDDLTLLGISTK